MQILIWKDGVQYNLAEEEVRQQLADRRLKLSDKASCEGARDRWIPLKEVLEFVASRQSERRNESGSREAQPPPPQKQPSGLDHHAVLGVSRTASRDEIKAAYRLRMQEYHPDKVAHLGADIRALAERKAKEINEAYQTLCP
jgi:DnaJ-domain-containing protein 1